jgi:hypothetical protein
MESVSKSLSGLAKNPTVKKLRAFEQSRMARMTTKQTLRKERVAKELKQLKLQVAESIKTQAEDLLELASIFSEDSETDE